MSYQPQLDEPVWFNDNLVNKENWSRAGVYGVLVTNIEGWVDGVDIRDTRDARVASDGDYANNLFLGGRTITISGIITAANFVALQASKKALTGIFRPSSKEQLLIVGNADISWPATPSPSAERSYCRVIEPVQFGAQHGPTAQEWVVVLRASDPRIYGAEQTVTDTSTGITQSVNVSTLNDSYPTPCTVQFTNSSGTLSGLQIVNSQTKESLAVKSTTVIGTDDSYLFDTGQRYLTISNADPAAFRLNNLSPTLYYKLDELSGTTAANYANPGTYTGTIVGTPTLGTAGAIGTRMDFDGVNDEVTVPYNAALVPDTFTLECFVSTTSTTDKPILEWSNGGTTGWYVTVSAYPAYNSLLYKLYVNNSFAGQVLSLSSNTTTGRHFAISKSGTTWRMTTITQTTTLTKSVTSITTGTIRIGRRSTSYFAGWIDNVVLYPSYLDDATISALRDPSAAVTSFPGTKNLDFTNNTWWQIQPSSQTIYINKSASSTSTLTVKYRTARL